MHNEATGVLARCWKHSDSTCQRAEWLLRVKRREAVFHLDKKNVSVWLSEENMEP